MSCLPHDPTIRSYPPYLGTTHSSQQHDCFQYRVSLTHQGNSHRPCWSAIGPTLARSPPLGRPGGQCRGAASVGPGVGGSASPCQHSPSRCLLLASVANPGKQRIAVSQLRGCFRRRGRLCPGTDCQQHYGYSWNRTFKNAATITPHSPNYDMTQGGERSSDEFMDTCCDRHLSRSDSELCLGLELRFLEERGLGNS